MRKQEQRSAKNGAGIMFALNGNPRPQHENPILHHERDNLPCRFDLFSAGSEHPAWQLYDWRSTVGHQWCDWDGNRRWIILVCAVTLMTETLEVGDPVEVYLDAKFGDQEGWHPGTIFKIDPYSEHRSFYWVRFDAEAAAALGRPHISVFNPKNIRRSMRE